MDGQQHEYGGPSTHSNCQTQMSEDIQPRTLYVGNLDTQTTEEFLLALFNHIGQVKSCKIINEPGDPYAFVEFWDHEIAANALSAMNKRSCFGKELKVNWASSTTNQPKPDTSKHYHIFVGDLSAEIDTGMLREAFAPFGEISDCRVVRDANTLKSKCYGFVTFVKKSEAETALYCMNGQWLVNRSIRTNWAAKKPQPPKSEAENTTRQIKQLTYNEVYNQTSRSNCTVYFGGITIGLSEEMIRKTFSPFGKIQEIRVFKDKGYSFIKFDTKESAAHAIVVVHNSYLNGQVAKCSWGKEVGNPTNTSNQQQYSYGSTANAIQFPYDYGQQLSYWGYPHTAAASYSSVLQNQFLQGMTGYSYGNFDYQQNTMGPGPSNSIPSYRQSEQRDFGVQSQQGRFGYGQRLNIGEDMGAWNQGFTYDSDGWVGARHIRGERDMAAAMQQTAASDVTGTISETYPR